MNIMELRDAVHWRTRVFWLRKALQQIAGDGGVSDIRHDDLCCIALEALEADGDD